MTPLLTWPPAARKRLARLRASSKAQKVSSRSTRIRSSRLFQVVHQGCSLVALRARIGYVEDEPLLTEPEAAKLLRVSTSTLKRWRLEGSGPPVEGYAGRSPRYRRSELLKWLRRPKG
jgi:predicted DNA-binding transcriptional regulator AlpA